MKFKKWHSITNVNKEKTIRKFIKALPEEDVIFEVTEKIDGANFSIIVDEHGNLCYARRNSVLEDTEDFYTWKDLFYVNRFNELAEFLSAYVVTNNIEQLQLYGELYGKKVLNRVYYGEGTYFKWFGLRIDNKLLSAKETSRVLIDFLDLKVPTLTHFKFNKTIDDFYDILKLFNIEINSPLTPKGYDKENIMEGIVIQPYDKVIKIGNDYFVVKYKNKKFVAKDKNKKKPAIVLSGPSTQLYNVLMEEINNDRTIELFSKYGVIQDKKDIGKYISFYLNDVLDDLLIEDIYNDLPKLEKKLINKQLSKKIFTELERHL